MTFVVTEICIGVEGEGCMEVCPEFCILSEPEDLMSFIDPARCTNCGACKEACVVGAIFHQDELPKQSQEFLAINEAWFARKKSGVRQRVLEIAREVGAPVPPSPKS